MNTSACRSAAFAANMDFTTNVQCSDPWGGLSFAGANYVAAFGGAPNRARLKTTGVVGNPDAPTVPIYADQEWYIAKMVLSGAKTVGTGSCSGCLDGACFVLNEVFLYQEEGAGDFHVTNPLDRQTVTWQTTGGSVTGGCPGATSTRNTTWGSLKSLYR
jgi:hypothetical protein